MWIFCTEDTNYIDTSSGRKIRSIPMKTWPKKDTGRPVKVIDATLSIRTYIPTYVYRASRVSKASAMRSDRKKDSAGSLDTCSFFQLISRSARLLKGFCCRVYSLVRGNVIYFERSCLVQPTRCRWFVHSTCICHCHICIYNTYVQSYIFVYRCKTVWKRTK